MTNTARTLKYLRDQGFKCGMVERFNSFTKQRFDLFGIIDIIAIKEHLVVGVQSCGQAYSEHYKKMITSESSIDWLESGSELMLIGWRKLKKKRGGKAMYYAPRIHDFSFNDWRYDDV